MSVTAVESFSTFRKRRMFFLLIVLILLGVGLKFLNLSFAYSMHGGYGFLEDVSGMSLLALARKVSWEDAISIGKAATASVVLGVVLLVSLNRLKYSDVITSSFELRELKRETQVCAFLFFTTFCVGRFFHSGIYFISLTHFVPLLVVCLLNPGWGARLATTRLLSASVLALISFGLAGSKTVLFYFVLALSLSLLYNKKKILRILTLIFISLIVYPYLNMYRSLASSYDVGNPAAVIFLALQQDLSNGGFVDSIMKPYGLILDRLVGLEGLIVATTLSGMNFKNGAEISFELLGFEGVGISLGLAGQLYLNVQNLGSALLLYPFAIVVLWNAISALDVSFTRLGFLSVGTYIYTKGILILIGGFRVADLKITFSVLGLILACAVALRYLPRKKAMKNNSENRI